MICRDLSVRPAGLSRRLAISSPATSGPIPLGQDDRIGASGTNRRLEVRGPAMADTLAAIAIVVFTAGIIVGVIVIVSLGIRREERDFLRTGLISMTRRAPDRVSGGSSRSARS